MWCLCSARAAAWMHSRTRWIVDCHRNRAECFAVPRFFRTRMGANHWIRVDSSRVKSVVCFAWNGFEERDRSVEQRAGQVTPIAQGTFLVSCFSGRSRAAWRGTGWDGTGSVRWDCMDAMQCNACIRGPVRATQEHRFRVAPGLLGTNRSDSMSERCACMHA